MYMVIGIGSVEQNARSSNENPAKSGLGSKRILDVEGCFS